MIWRAAVEVGVTTFVDSVRHTIQDDHLPLGAAGVPTALLIDFDYKYWHTENDTPDKCSAESLANVGRVLAHIIYNESLWPRK
jgi:Zn-dependent M28 family amino/carboxypeptidase